jgi:SAM-dependent methyltransferase
MKKASLVMICPACHQALCAREEGLACPSCRRTYTRHQDGYLDFTLEARLNEVDSTSEEYAAAQISSWRRFYQEYLKPWADQEKTERILEVGCGLGMGIALFRRDGYDAFGIDLPNLAPFWAREKRDPRHFFLSDGGRTPFPDGYFDAVITLGTIEHIGTLTGHNTLAADYGATRKSFAAELLRITKPGGRLLVSCPNKSFPVDIHHQPTDEATENRDGNRRQAIFARTGLNWHRTFGRHHLLSHSEIKKLFCRDNDAQSIRAITAKSYFAFKRTGSLKMLRRFKSLISIYIEHLPGPFRKTCLNPFLIVEIRR